MDNYQNTFYLSVLLHSIPIYHQLQKESTSMLINKNIPN